MGVQFATVEDGASAHVLDSSSTRGKRALRLKPLSARQALRIRLRALAVAIGTGAASYAVLRTFEALCGRR
jgi:hypothetical protein